MEYNNNFLDVRIECDPKTAKNLIGYVQYVQNVQNKTYEKNDGFKSLGNLFLCINYLGHSNCNEIARPFPCDGFDYKCSHYKPTQII